MYSGLVELYVGKRQKTLLIEFFLLAFPCFWKLPTRFTLCINDFVSEGRTRICLHALCCSSFLLPVCTSFYWSIDVCFFFLRNHFSFLLGLLGTSSLFFIFFLFSVLLFVLLFLVPWVKRGTGNGVRCRKRKTLKVIKDVNPDTQVKLKNKSRQWKTLNHRISC